MKSGKTLPAGSILEDMLSRLYEQVQLNSSRQGNVDLSKLPDGKTSLYTAVDNSLIGETFANLLVAKAELKKKLDKTTEQKSIFTLVSPCRSLFFVVSSVSSIY